MRIPDSVAVAYEEAVAVTEPLRGFAAPRLRVICIENNWLFDDRMKSAESCLSKLETGSGPMSTMHDLYAATVVVPTQNELDRAVEQILKRFDGDVKAIRTKSPEHFVYDDIHVLARLGEHVSPAAVASPVRERVFEIQVRTGLQYAWWRATHDQVYKSSSDEGYGWGVRRVSGQAKASLELLDNILADLPAAGRGQRPGPQSDPAPSIAREWLKNWNRSLRPKDEHRFSSTISSLLSICALEDNQVTDILASPELLELAERSDLIPGQVILAAVHKLAGASMENSLVAANSRVLITEELENAYPSISGMSADAFIRP